LRKNEKNEKILQSNTSILRGWMYVVIAAVSLKMGSREVKLENLDIIS